MKLSEIVKQYRADSDLSQREFAKRCGLSNSYISFIENERNPRTGKPIAPTIDQYKRLAGGMGIKLHDLLKSLDVDSPVVLSELYQPFNLQLFADKDPEEERLIKAYRGADPTYQKVALEILENHQKG